MKIELYGAHWCKPCRDSKKLLESKNIEYAFYDVDEPENHNKLTELLGKKIDTVPKIFIDGKLLGGYLELSNYLNK